MLRKGFTLAEVLIALLLVGILSSISIQTLRNRDNTAEYEAIRNKAMTNVQGVLHEALYAKSSSEIFGDETTGNYKEIMDFLNNRLGAGTATISGKDLNDGAISAKGQKMRDGSYYALTAKSGGALVAELTIDVNGDKAPNKEGTDIFKYNVDKFGGVLLSSISGSETEKSCKEKDPTKPFMWKDGSCHACPENIPNLMSDGSCQSCTSDYYHHGGCQSCPSSQWDNEKNACCKLVNGVCEKKEESCTGDLVKVNGTCQCPTTHPVQRGDECFFECKYTMSRVPVLAKDNSECPVKCDDGTIAPTQADCPVQEFTVTVTSPSFGNVGPLGTGCTPATNRSCSFKVKAGTTLTFQYAGQPRSIRWYVNNQQKSVTSTACVSIYRAVIDKDTSIYVRGYASKGVGSCNNPFGTPLGN